MNHLYTIAALVAAIAGTPAHAQTGSASVNVQSTPQGSTVVVQGGANIPLGKNLVLTPQVQVVVPPPATQAPPVYTGTLNFTLH